MNFFYNKRGLEIAIGTVAIIAIVLLVIIVIIGFFFGGFGRSGTAFENITGQAEAGAAGVNLRYFCSGTLLMFDSDCNQCKADCNSICQASSEDGNLWTLKDGASCSMITTGQAECSRARGCYWKFGQ